MAQAKKLSRKELKQPDTFQTKGEEFLQHFIDNRRRYLYAVLGFIGIILLITIASNLLQMRNDKISEVYADAMKVYDAPVVKDTEGEPQEGLTFSTEEAKYLAATEKFQTVVNEYGGSAYGNIANFYLGNSHFQLKRYEKAREAYQAFIDNSGSDFSQFNFLAYHNIAQSYDAEKKFDQAIETYKKILSFGGELWKDEASFMIADIYKREGNKAEAIKWYTDVTENYPDSEVKPKAEKMLTLLRGPKPVEKKSETPEAAEKADVKPAGEGG